MQAIALRDQEIKIISAREEVGLWQPMFDLDFTSPGIAEYLFVIKVHGLVTVGGYCRNLFWGDGGVGDICNKFARVKLAAIVWNDQSLVGKYPNLAIPIYRNIL